MASESTPEGFDDARSDVGLSVEELWLRYFALGGGAMPTEFEAYVRGALDPDRSERDILVHALNERAMELGSGRRWRYADETDEAEQ